MDISSAEASADAGDSRKHKQLPTRNRGVLKVDSRQDVLQPVNVGAVRSRVFLRAHCLPRLLASPPDAVRFADTCLIDSLRALGVRVPYTRHGPFWALKEGNEFLKPRKCLACSDCNASSICHREHFVKTEALPVACVSGLA